MMAFMDTEDRWIDYLIISRLRGCYATPIIQFFQDGRFRIKIDPQLESAPQTKARGLLHMECDFATALSYNLDFKKMSWTTFQPRGRSSTIEDFSKEYSRMLKNYSQRL
jgi:hypothetical protein